MRIDLVHLRTFVAVAEEQHLTRGAERIHVSLSAASAHIRSLEEALDTVLFTRTNRNLELTHAGKYLLSDAKELLQRASVFTSLAREIRGKTEGRLVIGSSSDPSASRIGIVVATLREQHPYINVELRARPSSGAREGLKTGELDIGIFLGRPIDPQLSYELLDNACFVVAGPAAWKERIATADWADLARLPWITPVDQRMAYAIMLNEMFDQRDLELNSVVQFDNEAIGRALMRQKVGMMLVREEHALRGEQEGVLARSPIARVTFPLVMAFAARRHEDPLIKAFMAAAKTAWPAAQPAYKS